MKLLRELINGNIFIDEDTSGRFKIKVSFDNSIDEGWEDITTCSNIEYYEETITEQYDYKVVQYLAKNVCDTVGWVNLTDQCKETCIKYNAYWNNTDKVTYYISKGYTQSEAITLLNNLWHTHHAKAINTCKQRWYYSKLVIIDRVVQSEVEDFCFLVHELKGELVEDAILGIGYGSNTGGFINWLESTYEYLNNGFVEAGLTLNYGTYQEAIDEIKKILVYGNYKKY